jgi:hypothetical protein
LSKTSSGRAMQGLCPRNPLFKLCFLSTFILLVFSFISFSYIQYIHIHIYIYNDRLMEEVEDASMRAVSWVFRAVGSLSVEHTEEVCLGECSHTHRCPTTIYRLRVWSLFGYILFIYLLMLKSVWFQFTLNPNLTPSFPQPPLFLTWCYEIPRQALHCGRVQEGCSWCLWPLQSTWGRKSMQCGWVSEELSWLFRQVPCPWRRQAVRSGRVR